MKLPHGMNLVEMKYMSFYLDGKLISEITVLFLKFDNDIWYKVTSCDGISYFEIIDEPEQLEAQETSDEFSYPIKTLEQYELKQFGKLQKIEEFLWKGQKDESCGFILKFDNGTFLNIIEKDDCLHLSITAEDELMLHCTLQEKLSLDHHKDKYS